MSRTHKVPSILPGILSHASAEFRLSCAKLPGICHAFYPLTLQYGFAPEQRGFGLSTGRDQQPASGTPSAGAKHRLTINLWQAELTGESFGRPARVSIRLNDIPQAAP